MLARIMMRQRASIAHTWDDDEGRDCNYWIGVLGKESRQFFIKDEIRK